MVIQRFQNLFLLLAAIIMGCTCFAGFVKFSSATSDYILSVAMLKTIGTPDASNQILDQAMQTPVYNVGLLVIGLVITLIILIALCMFKKLKLQKTLCYVSMCLTACFYLSMWMYSWFIMGLVRNGDIDSTLNLHLYPAAFFPLAVIALLWLAIIYIKKDARLLDDSFRIR